MRSSTLGRTGLTVSAAGLGAGGHSRLGLAAKGLDHAAGVVRFAYEQGITFFDTAQAYGTEEAVGKGLSGLDGSTFTVSSKFPPYTSTGQVRDRDDLSASVDETLKRLGMDHVDVFHLHAVEPGTYGDVIDRFYPVLESLKAQGKIRFLGITELFQRDTSHVMLDRALDDGLFDVIMAGYNLLNHSAARSVFPKAREKGIGVLCMFAVRNALSDPKSLAKAVSVASSAGQLPESLDLSDPLGFVREMNPAGVINAAYRFCSAVPDIAVTLTGTGSTDHLKENIASILAPPLPDELTERLREAFGKVDTVSGE